VNLLIGSEVSIPIGKSIFSFSMATGLPWKGNTQLVVKETSSKPVQLRIRIPGWLTEPVPGDLYTYADTSNIRPQLTINGKPFLYKTVQGYAVLERVWKKGDVIDFTLPLKVRRIISNPALRQNKDRVALQYGPMVYCVEGKDNDDQAYNFIVPASTNFEVNYNRALLGGVNEIKFDAVIMQPAGGGLSIVTVKKSITAIPYFSWNNRGVDEMQVWLPTSVGTVKITP